MSTYLQYNNHMILHPTDSSKYFIGIVDPLNPLMLPPYTIRLLYSDGFVPTFTKGTGVQLSSSPNIWDLTYESSDWSSILNNYMSYTGNHSELLEILGANTKGVTDTNRMVDGCEKLRNVAIFDTSLVTNMTFMFSECKSLPIVPLYNTSNVTNMRGMFQNCYDLTSVPLFDTKIVTRFDDMFTGCKSLTTIPLFDTRSATNISEMFYLCTNLTVVPLLDTKNVTNFEGAFSNCKSLTSIPLFDTRSATNMNETFIECTNVSGGALALFEQAYLQSEPPSSHMKAFEHCGIDTVTGAAELAEIPTSWGGLLTDAVQIKNQIWTSKNLAIDDGQGGIYTQTVNYGNGNVTEYYYTWDAALRVAATVQGWHLPTSAEWDTLATAVGGADVAGTKLKSTYSWSSGNGTDNYGFTALPAGYRATSGTFYELSTWAGFWTSTESNSTNSYICKFDTSTSMDNIVRNKGQAFTIRLVKD